MLVVENSVGEKFLCEQTAGADGLLLISCSYFLYPGDLQIKMERECTWSLEVESKLAEVILQREKWNLF